MSQRRPPGAGAPGGLWAQVLERSARATHSGAVQSIATDYHRLDQAGIPFMVRVLSGVQHKEAARRRQDAGQAEDPFLSYELALHVADLSDTHVCILNKFNVVEHHLLIITRDFEHQESLLSAADFAALWPCLLEIGGLGFYNAGERAGASQSHKHLQLVPLPLAPWEPAIPLTPRLPAGTCATASDPRLRFGHGACRLEDVGAEPESAPALLHQRYLSLLRATGLMSAQPPEPGWRTPPYNLLLTRDWMLLVPRAREHADGVSINALGFAGALLMRTEAQLARLREQGPLSSLEAVTCAAAPGS